MYVWAHIFLKASPARGRGSPSSLCWLVLALLALLASVSVLSVITAVAGAKAWTSKLRHSLGFKGWTGTGHQDHNRGHLVLAVVKRWSRIWSSVSSKFFQISSSSLYAEMLRSSIIFIAAK